MGGALPELAQRQQRVRENNERNNRNDPLPTLDDIRGEYGVSYRNILAEVGNAQDHYTEWFPELRGTDLELAGFVWFQGWNDQYGGEHEYAANMQHFIQDVRKDLNAPQLPFVIAAMGQNGSQPAEGAMLTIAEAQLAMNDVPELAGNVRAFRTDVLVDQAAEELYPQWRDRFEEWKRIGSDYQYHYFGSAIWFTRIGRAMGDAMLELIAQRELQAAPTLPD
jgi:alpha-galactosidase